MRSVRPGRVWRAQAAVDVALQRVSSTFSLTSGHFSLVNSRLSPLLHPHCEIAPSRSRLSTSASVRFWIRALRVCAVSIRLVDFRLSPLVRLGREIRPMRFCRLNRPCRHPPQSAFGSPHREIVPSQSRLSTSTSVRPWTSIAKMARSKCESGERTPASPSSLLGPGREIGPRHWAVSIGPPTSAWSHPVVRRSGRKIKLFRSLKVGGSSLPTIISLFSSSSHLLGSLLLLNLRTSAHEVRLNMTQRPERG